MPEFLIATSKFQLVTDAWYAFPTDELLANRLEAHKDSAATFVYLYNFHSTTSMRDLTIEARGKNDSAEYSGVYHGDELLLIMPMASVALHWEIDYMIDVIVGMWTNFAANA